MKRTRTNLLKRKKNENEDEVPKIEEEVKLPKLPSIEQKKKVNQIYIRV